MLQRSSPLAWVIEDKSMKRLRLLLFLPIYVGLLSTTFAQETITPQDAAKYIGQQKTVYGKVTHAYFAAPYKGQLTFLNFGRPYPDQTFTVLIWGSDRGKFEKPPERLYLGKEICVTGMIKSYRGKPEIIVEEPSQIKVK